MKTIYLKTAVIGLFICLVCRLQAEDVTVSIKSPDVAALGRYGAYDVNEYTGTPDITVPIHTIPVKGMEIPIYLSYDASGFIVNKDAGIVGQNWTLMSGGMITRTINGIADERCLKPVAESITFNSDLYGYWYGIGHRKDPPKTGEYIKNLSYMTVLPGSVIYPDLAYEHVPDLFTFHFCGHKGRFLIGNDGTVKVISERPYKVDLSEFQYYQNEGFIRPSRIKITSDDGYIFTFGGDWNTLEINLDVRPDKDLSTVFRPERDGNITAWYLTKIICPNGEEVNFNYENQDWNPFLDAGYMGGDRNYLEKIYYIRDRQTHETTQLTRRKQSAFVKLAYLDSITFPSGKVIFKYSEKQYSFYGDERPYPWRDKNAKTDIKTKRLDEIVVENAFPEELKRVSFSYDYHSSTDRTCYRMFLNGVLINDKQYRFNYRSLTDLPAPLTSSIDFWGYFNNSGRSTLFPEVKNISVSSEVDVSFRKTDTLYNNIGMLSEIIYPTGGSTRFIFETHDYGNVLKRDLGLPSVRTEFGYAGGVRIKQIRHIPGETIDYYYKNGFSLKNKDWEENSSGVLTDHNIFCINMKYANVLAYVLDGNNIISGTSIQEGHIGYSEVAKVIEGGGYTVTRFSTHLTHPDHYLLGPGTCVIKGENVTTPDFWFQMQRILKNSSREGERGKPVSLKVYRSDEFLLREESYTYNEDPDRFNQAVYAYHIPYQNRSKGVYHSYATYYYPNHLTQKVVREYNESGKIETEENYTYDPDYRVLKERKTKTSTNDVLSVKYNYPFDFGSVALYGQMTDKHIISPVVEKSIYKNNTFLSKESSDYKLFHSLFYAPSNLKIQIGSASEEVRSVYDYDKRGNPLFLSKDESDRTVYLWSYNYQYPVAEIKGATLSEVKNAMQGGAQLEFLGKATAPHMHIVDSMLRDYFRDKPVLITTYTYKPGVGITSVTTPDGVITTYEYDPFGRLETVRDKDGHILDRYKYHYQNQ